MYLVVHVSTANCDGVNVYLFAVTSDSHITIIIIFAMWYIVGGQLSIVSIPINFTFCIIVKFLQQELTYIMIYIACYFPLEG